MFFQLIISCLRHSFSLFVECYNHFMPSAFSSLLKALNNYSNNFSVPFFFNPKGMKLL